MCNKLSYDNIESVMEDNYRIIVDTFVNMSSLSKHDFFAKVFDSVFKLIPSAEKGSYYERDVDVFRPIFSNGYDMTLLQNLSFDEKDLFIGFEVSKPGEIEVYEFHNDRRDDSKFSDEDITVFKALGTYYEFVSLYAPIQIAGKNVGLICCERFDGKGYSQSDKLILKLYAQLISNFYTQMVQRENERTMLNEIIDSMVSAIELKDKYTEGHAKRVT